MSGGAQRVLDALIEYYLDKYVYPIQAICEFFYTENIASIEEDYNELTVDEEKKVIKAFLKFAF